MIINGKLIKDWDKSHTVTTYFVICWETDNER